MNKLHRTKTLTFVLPVVGLLLAGCATAPKAMFLDPEAFTRNIETIYVMPVVDGRTEKAVAFDSDDANRMRVLAKKRLEGHGFHAQLVEAWKADKQPTDAELAEMGAPELCNLVTPETGVFMVITINYVHDKYFVLSSNYSINGTLVVIERSSRKEIWKEAASGAYGGGGMLDSLVMQIGKKSFAQERLMNLAFASFPKKGTK